MKKGDKARVTWTDGLICTGSFKREERGYMVFEDDSGGEFVCFPGHARIELIEVKEEK